MSRGEGEEEEEVHRIAVSCPLAAINLLLAVITRTSPPSAAASSVFAPTATADSCVLLNPLRPSLLVLNRFRALAR